MKYGKSIASLIVTGVILIFLVVAVFPEIQRVSDQQEKIAERNAEIRDLKTSSWSSFEKEYGIKLPTLEQCENVNSGSSSQFQEGCKEVWRMVP